MDRFLIVTNDGKDTDHSVTAKVKNLLTEAGKTCILCQKDEKKNIIRNRFRRIWTVLWSSAVTEA